MLVAASPASPVGAAAEAGTAGYTAGGLTYDYAIGGLPFFNGISAPEQAFRIRTMERATAPYRKDQFDNSSEPGE